MIHRRQMWVGALVCLVVAALFVREFFTHVRQSVDIDHPDAYLGMFLFAHFQRVVTTGNWSMFLTAPMFFGFLNSLAFSELLLVPALIVVPLSMLAHSVVIAFNLTTVLTVVAGVFAMYFFLFSVTGAVVPSVAGAVIYGLNPFVMGLIPDQIHIFSLQWIPLIFWFVERALAVGGSGNLLMVGVLVGLQVLTGLSMAVYLSVLLPVYIGVRLWQLRRSPRTLITGGTFAGGLFVLLIVLGIWNVYRSVDQGNVLERPLINAEWFSARPWDLVFGAPTRNFLYGGLRQWAQERLPNLVAYEHVSEQSMFIGIVPALTALAGLWLVKRRTDGRSLWWAAWVVAGISLVLSWGPVIHVTDTVGFPGPYGILYRWYPLFRYLRVPERFGAFFFFGMAMMAAITLAAIVRGTTSAKKLLVFVLTGLILLEYVNHPVAFMTEPQTWHQVYETLTKRNDIGVIVDLPIANNIEEPSPFARSILNDSRYLLWATLFHHKTLLNGYSGYLPPAYYMRSLQLTFHFPTREKLRILQSWGVDAIVLHRDEYISPDQYDAVRSALIRFDVPVLVEVPGLVAFDLTVWR